MPQKKYSFIVPVYNHSALIESVIDGLRKYKMPIIVINDGSDAETTAILHAMKDIILIHHDTNRGKGAAIKTGLKEAQKYGNYAISIDGDGQHNPDDASLLLEKLNSIDERPIVIGNRLGMDNDDVPWKSKFGRKFSNFWVFASGGPRINDTQSGFRAYPVPEITNINTIANRFQYEVEIVVRANWFSIPVVEVPISVDYSPGGERISHFRPFVDFMRNSYVFTSLIIMRLLYIPIIIIRKRYYENKKK
jgi:glycosyltransferase involved in cell wall biosynthesis